MSVDMSCATPGLIDCCRPLDAEALGDEEAEATARLFKALSDPARVKIVNLLAHSEGHVCCCELVPELRLTQATVSHHLMRLGDVGLLEREQRGKWAYFTLNPDASSRLAGLVQIPEVVR